MYTYSGPGHLYCNGVVKISLKERFFRSWTFVLKQGGRNYNVADCNLNSPIIPRINAFQTLGMHINAFNQFQREEFNGNIFLPKLLSRF